MLTRRRSRVSENPVVIDSQSQPQSQANARKNDKRVDDEPEQVTRHAKGYCKKCNACIGEFYNSWTATTNTYFLPVLDSSYSTPGLSPSGRVKAASAGTDLYGCEIQPLSCNKCKENCAFVCTNAPEQRSAWIGREFFKLPRIDLRCDPSGEIVQPIIEGALPEARQRREQSSVTIAGEMEVEKPTPAHQAQASAPQEPVYRSPPIPAPLSHAQPPAQSIPPIQKPTPANNPHRSPPVQSAPHPPPPATTFAPPVKEPPATRFREYTIPDRGPAHHQSQQHHPVQQPSQPSPQYQQPPRPFIVAQYNPHSPQERAQHAPHHQPPPPPPQHQPSPQQQPQQQQSPYQQPLLPPQTNGQHYPALPEVNRDALARLQTEMSYNTASLNSQKRDIERIDGAVTRLQQEMIGMRALIEGVQRELHARPVPAAPTTTPAPDSALELFATNLTNLATKVSEVDGIKMQMEILKRKLARLEEGSVAPAATPAPFQSPRDPPIHSAHSASAHSATSFHGPHAVPRISTPMRHDARVTTGAYQTPTEISRTIEPEVPSTQSTGWVSVNPSVKRGLPNGTDGAGHSIGSPKRPKLAPIEPRVQMESTPSIVYERMDTEEIDSRNHSRESVYETSTPSTFVHYHSTNETDPEASWQPVSQRHGHRSPKRGGRGGGRGGRPRKSYPPDVALGTPEWEKPDWTGSQIGPDGYYQPTTPGGTKRGALVRRGSGGGGGNVSMRPMEVSRMMADPYAHTKKTRTKPTRNADGILIRKDGRPDMRSQSSAANLRKVHARKEQEKALERQNTPTSSIATSHHHGFDTPSPADSTAEPTTMDRHESIMKQMFPNGVIDGRSSSAYAERFFPANSSPLESKVVKSEATKSPVVSELPAKEVVEDSQEGTTASEVRTQPTTTQETTQTLQGDEVAP